MADGELVQRVALSTGLTDAAAARVIDDVLAWYAEPVEVFVRRRHAEQQLVGLRNADIYPAIVSELRDRVVAAPALSVRQLRRMIYS